MKKTKLAFGNNALREGRFEDAIVDYEIALKDASGPLRKHILFNIDFAKQKIKDDLGTSIKCLFCRAALR
ncbi:MAG: hypothetical protein ACK443_04315 [Methylococcaceae bacterium]